MYILRKFQLLLGSGSGQQSITAFPEADDSNSFWLVRASLGKQCKRG